MRHNLSTDLENAFKTALGLGRRQCLLVPTSDPVAVFRIASDLARAHQCLLIHGRPHRLSRWENGKVSPIRVPTSDPAGVLNHLLKNEEERAIVLLEDFVTGLQGNDLLRSLFADLMEPAPCGRQDISQLLVLVDGPGACDRLPPLFGSQIEGIGLPYPTCEELRELVAAELPDLEQGRCQFLAEALTGFTRTAARQHLWRALAEHPKDLDAVRATLQNLKEAVLSKEMKMTFLDTEHAENPEGLDEVWDYLRRHRKKIGIPGHGRLKGLLLVGPPGTGKTMMARAIGKQVGLRVLNFEVGRLMGSLVGQTENNFLEATAVLNSLGPLVVFIDEIEKALSGAGSSGQTDGGTMARAYGTLLSFLSDTEAPLFFVGTANGLEKLGEFGATLARPGRFNAVFFVDYPDAAAREAILKKAIQKHGAAVDPEIKWSDLIERTEGCSGADLFNLVGESAARAEADGATLSNRYIEIELAVIEPRRKAQIEQFANLREWGLLNCRPAFIRKTQ